MAVKTAAPAAPAPPALTVIAPIFTGVEERTITVATPSLVAADVPRNALIALAIAAAAAIFKADAEAPVISPVVKVVPLTAKLTVFLVVTSVALVIEVVWSVPVWAVPPITKSATAVFGVALVNTTEVPDVPAALVQAAVYVPDIEALPVVVPFVPVAKAVAISAAVAPAPVAVIVTPLIVIVCPARTFWKVTVATSVTPATAAVPLLLDKETVLIPVVFAAGSVHPVVPVSTSFRVLLEPVAVIMSAAWKVAWVPSTTLLPVGLKVLIPVVSDLVLLLYY